jgi:membrane protein insertase Oxa1/YidC/SpoIIIJ
MRDLEELYLILLVIVFTAFLFPVAFTAISDAEVTNANAALFEVLPIILVAIFICVPVAIILAWRGSL